jgi:hypothetical protein
MSNSSVVAFGPYLVQWNPELKTVLQLKERLQAQIGAPISEQVLLFRETECKNDGRLIAHVVSEGTSTCVDGVDFHVVIRYFTFI